MHRFFAILLVGLYPIWGIAQDSFQIISYNVENLFDIETDSLNQDNEFTPTGERHWTYDKYQNKLRHIAQVIANIGGWKVPALIGLMEVENAQCLYDLTHYHLQRYRYRFLHQDSPDERGIDCALLYDAQQFQLLDSAFLSIPLAERTTRDILYAKGAIGKHHVDTLHVFVCHLPSQVGGTSTGERRDKAFTVLQQAIDSILTQNKQANIVVMGDMNQEPTNNLKGLQNSMVNLDSLYGGTHKYNGIWNYLDQFYTTGYLLNDVQVSVFSPDWLVEDDPKFAGKRPIRTYHGFQYQQAGYSDHLPIVLQLIVPSK